MKEALAGVREAGLEVVGFRNVQDEGDRPWLVIHAVIMLYM